MTVQLLNGTNAVTPMQGTNSVNPMQGTNSVTPLNGTNRVIPMQGTYGMYNVSPLAMMDVDDVPDEVLNGLGDLDPDAELLLRTAYIMGDDTALNGKLGDKIKNLAKGWLKGVEKIAPVAVSLVPGGAALAPVVGKGLSAVNQTIAAGEAAKAAAAAAGMPAVKVQQAGQLAQDTTGALLSAGIQPNLDIVADRAVMSVDAGAMPTKSAKSGGGVAAWWQARSNVEKGLMIGGTILIVGGTIYYISKNKKKKRG